MSTYNLNTADVLFVLIYVLILCDLDVQLAPVLIIDIFDSLYSSYALFSEAWHESRTFSYYFLLLLLAYMATHGRFLYSF